MSERPTRFCFNVYPYDRLLEVEDLVRVVRAGEAAGFGVVTFADHLLPPPASHEALVNRSWWDLASLCSFLAAHTRQLRFYLNVLVLPYHPPIQLAKSLASLDRLSNGRLLVGAGTGWYEEEFERLGLPFAERGDMTDEYARAMIELWTAERPRFRGKYVSFEDVSFYPKPVQKPHPPLLIGGTGPRPFRRAAEIGAGWVPMQGTHEQIAAQFRSIQALARELGRDADALWLGAGIALGAGSEGERAAEHIRGRSAPVVPRSSAEAMEQIRRLMALGVNLISVSFTWADPADYAAQLERFGREVIGPLRASGAPLSS
jgi:probable F420-dependent oxidoreductase